MILVVSNSRQPQYLIQIPCQMYLEINQKKKKNLQKVQPTNVFNIPLIFLPIALPLRVYAVIFECFVSKFWKYGCGGCASYQKYR